MSKKTEITPFNYNGHALSTITDERTGDVWFIAKDVCSILEIQNVSQAVANLDDDERSMFKIGRQGEVNVINESGLYSLILNSRKPEAKPFKKWVTSEVLPSIRKTGSYTVDAGKTALSKTQASIGLMLLRAAAQDLKFSQSALLGSYQRLEAMTGISGLLPNYATDAPTTSTEGSSEPTKALKFLLEDHNVIMSAMMFNQLLKKHGFLEEHTRPSSSGTTKKFWSVTDPEYGKNVTSPNNPRETQPHWYVSKFAELLELVMPASAIA